MKMSRLNTKLYRELLASRWQFVAVGATVMLGIAFFLGSLLSYGNLSKSYDLTYRKAAFGDVWVRMASAPDSLVRRAAQIPGVRTVIGRNVEEIRVELRAREVTEVMGRIISLPAARQPAINRVRVVEGRYLSPQGRREALLEISFAKAHKFRAGDFIYPTIRGREIRFRVVGLVQSPEYIYSIQSEQYLMPTPDTFGVIFIPERQAEILFGRGGAINEICLTTEPGMREVVAKHLEKITDRYGGEDPITRDEQPSNKLLMMDLEGYRHMAITLPLFFLGAAILTTYTLLARIVQAQRPQIGVLRANGFTQRAILSHFLWLALIPALIGGLLGIGLGYLFAWYITRLYLVFINIPYLFMDFRPDLTLIAFLVAAAAGLIGALAPARAAARLAPAVAMSQEAMTASTLPVGVRWLGMGLPSHLKMPVRNLIRRPRRTFYTVLGIALGVILIMLSFGMLDGVDYAIVTFFEDMERYDVSAVFALEQPGHTVSRIEGWPGVRRAEPTLEVAVELEHDGITHLTILSGLPHDAQLRRLTDESGRRIIPAPGEVLLGTMLRNKLKVDEGDRIILSYAQNRRGFNITRTARVGPAISQPIGSMAYMRMEEVQRLFGDKLGMPMGAASGVLIRADPERIEWIKGRLNRVPAVAAVQTRKQTYGQIQELMRFSKMFTGVLAAFGIGLAFAVVFTAVSVNVLERTRELATLRTLGFGFPKVIWLTTLENLMIAAVGAAIGVPLGCWLNDLLMSATQTESMSLEPVIYLRTYLISILGVLFLTLASQAPSLLHIRRMNLATATKQITG